MSESFPKEVSQWPEVSAVTATGVVFLIFESLGAKGLFIALASISWISYILRRLQQDSRLWVKWGFHTRNLSSRSELAAQLQRVA